MHAYGRIKRFIKNSYIVMNIFKYEYFCYILVMDCVAYLNTLVDFTHGIVSIVVLREGTLLT